MNELLNEQQKNQLKNLRTQKESEAQAKRKKKMINTYAKVLSKQISRNFNPRFENLLEEELRKLATESSENGELPMKIKDSPDNTQNIIEVLHSDNDKLINLIIETIEESLRIKVKQD